LGAVGGGVGIAPTINLENEKGCPDNGQPFSFSYASSP
jgi:hypothetical protein